MADYGREIIANLSQDGIYVTVHGEEEFRQRVFNLGGNLVFASTKSRNTERAIDTLRKKAGKKIALEKLVSVAEKVLGESSLSGTMFVCGQDKSGRYNIMSSNMKDGEKFSKVREHNKDQIIVAPMMGEPETLELIAGALYGWHGEPFQFGFMSSGKAKVMYDPEINTDVVPQREYKKGIISGNRRAKVNAAFYDKTVETLKLLGDIDLYNGSQKTMDRLYSSLSNLVEAYQSAGYGMLGRMKNTWTLFKAGRVIKRAEKEYEAIKENHDCDADSDDRQILEDKAYELLGRGKNDSLPAGTTAEEREEKSLADGLSELGIDYKAEDAGINRLKGEIERDISLRDRPRGIAGRAYQALFGPNGNESHRRF